MNNMLLIQKTVFWERELAKEAAARRDRHSMAFEDRSQVSGPRYSGRRLRKQKAAYGRHPQEACQGSRAR